MMYPFMTLNDETEIVHSDMQNDGRVKVYIGYMLAPRLHMGRYLPFFGRRD